MSCRRGPKLRRRWSEFPLQRARDGRADLAGIRLFQGRPGADDLEEPLFLDEFRDASRRRESPDPKRGAA